MLRNCFCALTCWLSPNYLMVCFISGRARFSYCFLSCCGWFLTILHIFSTTSQGTWVFLFYTDSAFWKIVSWDSIFLLIETKLYHKFSAQAEWMDWELCSGCELHQLALVGSTSSMPSSYRVNSVGSGVTVIISTSFIKGINYFFAGGLVRRCSELLLLISLFWQLCTA